MLKRFAPLMGAFAIVLGLLAGCQDSPTASPTAESTLLTADGDEAYKIFEVNPAAMNDFSDILTPDQALEGSAVVLPPDRGRKPNDTLQTPPNGRDTTHRPPPPNGRDTTNRPPNGRDTTNRPPNGRDTTNRPPNGRDTTNRPPNGRDTTNRPPNGRDTTRKPLQPINYRRIIGQLNLTPEQDSLIRLCIAEYRSCTQSAEQRYRNARMDALQNYHAQLRDIRGKLAAGEITREEARAQVERVNAAYRQSIKDLETAFKRAVEQCKQEFESCVTSHLTPEQLAIWTRLLGR